MPNGLIKLTWGDGEHVFNLAKIGQVLELEEKCDAGVYEIYTRLIEKRWRINDVRETIRLGLIGGGMKPEQASVLVKRYVDESPWAESVQPALAILMASMIGVPGDEVGKQDAEQTATVAPKTSDSAKSAPPSTVSPPLSGSPQGKPTKSPSGNLPPAPKPTGKPTQPASPSRNP